jgi:hypothetical protein
LVSILKYSANIRSPGVFNSAAWPSDTAKPQSNKGSSRFMMKKFALGQAWMRKTLETSQVLNGEEQIIT